MAREPAPPNGDGGSAASGTKQSARMVDRFKGPDGKARLLEVIRSNRIVGGDAHVAEKIVAQLQIEEFPKNHELIKQQSSDNDLYFILSGAVVILVNGREIATRSAGDHVGEMALLDSTMRRSASALVTEDCVVGVITEPAFTAIATEHPALWRAMAVALSQRIMQRNRFHTAPRDIPAVFIGSSSEGLHIAEAIHKRLGNHPCTPVLWSQDVFDASQTTIEDLVRATLETDFAVMILTPDDMTRSRKRDRLAPRDNVIFELGLFMGALTRPRTYIVMPKGKDLKIPTDLLGVTHLPYKYSKPVKADHMRSVYTALPKLIAQLGPR